VLRGKKLALIDLSDKLLAQEFNEGIPSGLPQNVKVAHKTGSIKGIHHDFGIIFPNSRKPYLQTIMTRGFEQDKTATACAASISDQFMSNSHDHSILPHLLSD
jgi:beta-lactamase class A